MDIELLRTFLEVRKSRHFGKAAENLHVTQAAVSARIKQLETTLGAAIFSRYRNNLQLTQTGERLVGHAETILIAWERARQEVALKSQQQLLSLGASSGLWDLLLQDVLLEIHHRFADLTLRAEVLGPDALIRQLMERTLDLALLYEPAKLTDLVSEPVAQAELMLVSSNPATDTRQALATAYVAVDWGHTFQIAFSESFPDTPPPAMYTGLSRVALDFIQRFGGSAYLPHRMIEQALGRSVFQVTDAPVMTRQIFACYRHDNPLKQEIGSIISLAKEMSAPTKDVCADIEI